MTLENIINFPLLHRLVSNLLKDYPNFKDLFLKNYPQHTADVTSLLSVPNCTCRDRIEVFVHRNSKEVGELVFNFLQNDNIQINLESFLEEHHKRVYISGTIIETTIDKWKNLSEKLRKDGAIYKGFSVVLKEDNKILVFFI